MGLPGVPSFGVFWNEGGTYVFYAESLDSETRRGTLSSIDDRRVPRPEVGPWSFVLGPWSTSTSTSKNQHRVAIAVEVISALDGFAIRGEDSLSACESRDKHEKRRLRQVKVCDEPLDDAKAMTGMNEE